MWLHLYRFSQLCPVYRGLTNSTELNYFNLQQRVCKELSQKILSEFQLMYYIPYIVIGRALNVIQGYVNRGPIIIWKS